MQKTAHEMLQSQEFRSLVSRRWTLSVVLTLLLFVVYYGYILLIGYDKSFMAQKIGTYTTLGIPLGVLVIVAAWVLTGIYVVWANRHDQELAKLKSEVKL
jgi:uncharacterized membrane protein (DUF485 family)